MVGVSHLLGGSVGQDTVKVTSCRHPRPRGDDHGGAVGSLPFRAWFGRADAGQRRRCCQDRWNDAWSRWRCI